MTRATRTAERTQQEQGDAEKQASEDTERIMDLEKECNELRIESELAKELMDQAEVHPPYTTLHHATRRYNYSRLLGLFLVYQRWPMALEPTITHKPQTTYHKP